MLLFHPLTEEEKVRIADWRYPGDYALYNMPPYAEDLKTHSGFAHPDFVGFAFYEDDRLIGFTSLYEEAQEIMLGIGIAPESCGQGYGARLIQKTCELSERLYPKKPLYLEVRSWNRRAIRCYEKAGFAIDGAPFRQITGLGEGIFYRMVKQQIQKSASQVEIKPMQTEQQIKGKAYVHWKAWHEAYPGLVNREYLNALTLEKCEAIAQRWTDGILVAEADGRVIGFVGYGDRGDDAPDTGEVFALYVLADYYGTGVAQKLMNAALDRLKDRSEVCLWVLKENQRAIRFYEKCGFRPDGAETFSPRIAATEIRMVRKN